MSSFFKGLIKKDKEEEKGPLERDASIKKELAAKPVDKERRNPVAADEGAAQIRKVRSKVPTDEQRQYFDAMRARDSTMGRMLVNSGLVNEEMIKQALRTVESEAGTTLTRQLVEHGFVREDDVLDALAMELGMERISLQDIEISPELIAQLPKKIAGEYKVFPVRFDAGEIDIAISDPLNIQVIDDLERILQKKVRTYICSEEEIARYFQRWYEGDAIIKVYEQVTDAMHAKELDEKHADINLDEDLDEEAPPVVRFVDLIFKQAVHDRASDIHIEPSRHAVQIRFRVDGVLHEVPSPPKKWQNAILSRLKVLSGMDLAEKRVPQDGRIKLTLPDKKLDLRVSALPAIHGESVVMRILDQSSVLLGLEDVGFLPDNIRLFNDLIRRPNGVILMTGPTGSGKTTTLYSALSTINSPEVKIVTIENPVEYMLEGVVQVQVSEDVGLDFTLGLRSILRQSPDVLLVGEMRDLETAEIGVRAALTGHLVFSTLHTNDAPSAPGRLVDMGVKPFLVASSLQAAIAQRLLRKLCNNCKRRYTPTPEEFDEFGTPPEERDVRHDISTFAGCDRCSGTGYKGRSAIHEIMVVDTRLRQMVIKGESAFRMKKVAIRGGMRSLRMDGWEKVKLGITTTNEVKRTTQAD